MKPEVVIFETGVFDKKRLVEIHNKVVDLWNASSEFTYMTSVFYKNGKRLDKWVKISTKDPENVKAVKVWKCQLTPSFIN